MPVFRDDVSGFAFDSLVTLVGEFIDKFNAHTHGAGAAVDAAYEMTSGSTADPITFKF